MAAADKHEWMDSAKILYEIEIWQVGVETRVKMSRQPRANNNLICYGVKFIPNLNPSPHENAEWPVISDEGLARFGPKALRK